jgi:hypothetical protein
MGSRQAARCLWCDSTDVIQRGLSADDQTEDWFAGASDLPPGRHRQCGCRNCGRVWSHVPLKIRRGEVIETGRGPIKATATDLAWLRQIRAFLLAVFAQQRHVDAADLKEHVGLPHQLEEVARLLELLTQDCTRRGEPSLTDLVDGLPEPPAVPTGEATAIISQADINDLLDGVYDSTEPRDDPNPAPEPA